MREHSGDEAAPFAFYTENDGWGNRGRASDDVLRDLDPSPQAAVHLLRQTCEAWFDISTHGGWVGIYNADFTRR
ncbi:MAG: hypothetical protein ACOC0P_07620, partial [Planctomycetota bacterium]